MSNSPKLGVPYIISGQSQKEVTHNDAMNDVDSLAQISVISSTLNTPPASPAAGDSYIIGASPTGVWSGLAGKITSYYSGWRTKTPLEGWVAWVQDIDTLYIYTGSAWAVAKVYVPVGSVTAPGAAFDGDTDTGLYHPAADTVAIAAGGKNVAQFPTVVSAVNYFTLSPAATGSGPALTAAGSDTNVDLVVAPKGTGLLKVNTSGSFAANGSVATALSSVGPTGAHTTVQEWLAIKNSAGTVRYIPCF